MPEPMEFSGFVGPSYVTRLLQTSCEECINLFPDQLESPGAKPSVILRRTPGIVTAIETFNGAVLGQFQQDGRAFAVDNGLTGISGQLYETTTGAAVAIGNVLTNGTPVIFDTNGSAQGAGGHQLVVLSAGTLYVLDLISGTFGPVTSAGFPNGQILSVAYFQSFFLALTINEVWQSATENGTSWNAASVQAREFTTDNNVAFANHYALNMLVILGTKRGEFWVNNGGAIFSFGPISAPGLNVGIAAGGTLKRFNGTLSWLGVDEHGTRIVYLLNGYTPLRISTLAVEYDLSTFASVSDFVAFVYQEEGHENYVLTSIVNKRTWVFDGKERLWHKRSWRDPASGIDSQIRGWNHCVNPSGGHWVGDWQKGTIYTQSLNLYSDDGNPQRWVRVFPHLLAQNRRVFYGGLEIQATQGQGLAIGQGVDPQAILDWSDDGGETYSNSYTRSLGKQGQYGHRTYWQNLGAGRNRAFRLSGNDPTPLALLSAYFNPPPVAGSN